MARKKVGGRWYFREQSRALLGWSFVASYAASLYYYALQGFLERRRVLYYFAVMQALPIIFHVTPIVSANFALLVKAAYFSVFYQIVLAGIDSVTVARSMRSPFYCFAAFHGATIIIRIFDIILLVTTNALNPWILDSTRLYDTIPV